MSTTVQLPSRYAGMRSVAGLHLDANLSATVPSLTTKQTNVLAKFGATIGGVLAAAVVPQVGYAKQSGSAVVAVNTATATTSTALDTAVFTNGTAPFDGVVATDPTAHLALVRQAGKWYKTAALTLIA